MIYLVTKEKSLFGSSLYKNITVEESLEMIKGCNILQYDSETSGIDCHLAHLLCIQIGNKTKDFQIVIDATTIDIRLYKDVLENTLLIGHNIKFDLKFLYNYNIIPRKVYDTMIVEQLLFLGYPKGIKRYSLAAIANERLGVDIDKSIRGQIIWRGLDETTIEYSANDVKYLEDIMLSQKEDYTKYGMTKGAILECNAVPSIAYLEWCGIKLDENKWKTKMEKDLINLNKSIEELNKFILSLPSSNTIKIKVTVKTRRVVVPIYTIDKQLDLFNGFNMDPAFNINWASSEHVIAVAKFLGFDTQVKDKKTGEDKDSVMEKHLSNQKGINDEFLKLYFNYAGYAKVVSSFGQGHLNSINPVTGRLHTEYHQLGASSSRISSGSKNENTDLQKYKKLPKGSCKYPNIQQLPADEATRSSFVSEKGYKFISADFSAEESRLGADIYNDIAMKEEFLYGSGDMHSLFAWMVFRKECEELGCTSVADVKKKAPQWRKKVKSVEFAWMFGAAAPTIAQSANCTIEEAQNYINNLEIGFAGVASFAKKGSMFVRKNGYIVINPITGHRKWWWDHKEWLARQKTFTPEFWEDYRENHKGTNSSIAQMVKMHFQAASKYDRDARNVVTQGTGAIIMKQLMTDLFNWIVNNNYFNKVKIVASVHDEVSVEYPEELSEFPNILTNIMENAASIYCKSLPIPAEASVGLFWIH